MSRWIVMLGQIIAVATAVAQPSNCRLYLAAQYDWGAKTGFYLDLEGAVLKRLPLILGVADGSQWVFASHIPGFEAERPYAVKAVIRDGASEVYLDGEKVISNPGGYLPSKVGLVVSDRPAWASESGDWVCAVGDMTVTVERAGEILQTRQFDFADAARAVPLMQFEPGRTQSAELAVQPGDTVVVELALQFASSDTKAWAPYIDRYGQSIHAEYPEKVRSDKELVADIAREDEILAGMPPSEDYDAYGGYLKAGWTSDATGFFRILKRDGKWWLITPDGNPCFYLGVSNVPATGWPTTPVSDREYLFADLPPRDGAWGACWGKNHWGVNDGTEYACFYTANLIRKYGPEAFSDRALERALQRLRCWGFSGGGKWGGPSTVVTTPVLNRWSAPNLVDHPDVFDPVVREKFREGLRQQIAPRKDDPMVLGWSLGNEFDEHIKPEEIRKIMAMPAATAAKRALIDHLVETRYGGSAAALAAAWKVDAGTPEALYAAQPEPSQEDLEAMRCFYADRYYQFAYTTVKEIDPNHLYLGFWIVPGWWVNEQDWHIGAKYCDVIGYDRYRLEYPEERLDRLQQAADKPALCGEFSFPSWYAGQRGFGKYGVATESDAESGKRYHDWVRAAANDPYCVGLIWFHFRDQPLTGRGPGRGDRLFYGEHFAFGLVRETDRPKWDMIEQMREANLNAAPWRLGLAR